MTIAYFSISGLDILGALEDLGQEKKTELIDWIYSLQVTYCQYQARTPSMLDG